jgi:hypothetical protein
MVLKLVYDNARWFNIVPVLPCEVCQTCSLDKHDIGWSGFV